MLAGCAVLTKVSASVPLAAIALAAALRAVRRNDRRTALRALALRGAGIATVFALLAGPYYGRNIASFGTPFMTSHGHPKVKAMEARQPPGERTWRDFVSLPGPALLHDSSFDAPHVLRSVWGSVYLNAWFDTYRSSQFARWALMPPNDYPIHRETLLLAGLGAIPTSFALWGAALMLRSAWRDRDAIVDLTLALVALASLAFFVVFAARIPTFAAVKASYLLALAVPYGWALARGVEAALHGPRPARWLGAAGCTGLGIASLAATAVLASGGLYPERPDHRDIHALRAFFGAAEPAREWFREPGVPNYRHAVEVLGSIELGAGEPERAAELFRSVASGSVTAEFINALAVSSALAGRSGEAVQLWDRALRTPATAELRVNRGSVRAASGDLSGGRGDLERALAEQPDIAVGWSNLAWIDAALGNAPAAAIASQRAAELAARAPRGFPYGVGDGDLDYAGRGQRWLLRLTGPASAAGLELYRPPRARYGPDPG